jgi:hypothetical protein
MVPVFLSLFLAPEAAWQEQPVVSAQRAAAQLLGELAAQDAAVAALQALPGGAVAQQREAAAVPDALVALLQEAGAARIAVQPVAARGAAVQRPGAAVLAGEGLLREAPSAVAWALPWAVVWAFRRDPTPPWPVPQPAA